MIKWNFVQLHTVTRLHITEAIDILALIEAAAKHVPKKQFERECILKLNSLVFMAERISKALAQAKEQIKSKPL